MTNGNKFRMFEPTGEKVVGAHDFYEWMVTNGPYGRKKDEVWAVEC